ncbi:immune inhibitor A domain-containing protein [Streptomyces sp. SM12]|uniref:immune inhibitor A domain-containing protein n=1 Tax=Streptomyces sp. SM12 TaxID=1071602 RepID=UPI0015E1ABE2|nr:immune inhibitor A domain-containing protein [Streptomyces sp. SM12]
MNRSLRSKRSSRVIASAGAIALGATLLGTAGAAHAVPTVDAEDGAPTTAAPRMADHADHLENPLGEKRVALKQEAHSQLITGQARPRSQNGSEVVELSDGQFAEVATTGTDRIFTILVEFGDEIHPEYGGDPGPLANQIEEPDRSVDNTTIWQSDFSQAHFEDLYFGDDPDQESVKKYFENQSSGRYSIEGHVTDWVKVDYNEARYGNSACGSNVCRSVWEVVSDGVDAWYEDQLARGLSHEEVEAILSEYDIKDRYDYNGNGDFNEPDGYIDHFQIVHAGEDASAGGGAQGDDAIWAHRWFAFYDLAGQAGPEGNLAGGTRIGETDYWVGDYTIQPENGGVGVFAHEFAHDLGLPDLYDTAGGENGTTFWSAMSSGSWLGLGDGTIGALPNEMGAWEKLQLGWLDYTTAKAAKTSVHRIGSAGLEYPEGRNSALKGRQALIVELPEKEVTNEIVAPAQGDLQWYSGSGNSLENTLTREVDLTGATTASLELTGWWQIEEDYDFLYVEARAGGAGQWTALDGTADGDSVPRDGADRPALHGASDGHAALVYPLDEFAGDTVELRFRYLTDVAVADTGFTADEITVTADGEAVFEDDAENGEGDWAVKGFSLIGESITSSHEQFYIVENRQYTGYDRTLERGPYNFGFLNTRPDWVEHFSFQTGMLVWLWDTSQTDNNTSSHPGQGLILPVDAHAKPDRWADGTVMRNRFQSRDATFSWKPTERLTIHQNGVPTTLRAKPGNPVFDDRRGTYWYEENPGNSVQVPDTNTRITVLTELPFDGAISVLVSPSR